MDALQISPKYTAGDWQRLNVSSPKDWMTAADIVRDRLNGRFLQFANHCLESEHSEFVVLAIDCLLVETIQQFKDGVTNGHGQSKKLVTRFLKGSRFAQDFDHKAREAFYRDIRCGLLHQAEAKGKWVVRRAQPSMLQVVKDGQVYIIDIKRFHAGVEDSLKDYLACIRKPASSLLRSNLWKKMNHICDIRMARGALVDADVSLSFPAERRNK